MAAHTLSIDTRKIFWDIVQCVWLYDSWFPSKRCLNTFSGTIRAAWFSNTTRIWESIYREFTNPFFDTILPPFWTRSAVMCTGLSVVSVKRKFSIFEPRVPTTIHHRLKYKTQMALQSVQHLTPSILRLLNGRRRLKHMILYIGICWGSVDNIVL